MRLTSILGDSIRLIALPSSYTSTSMTISAKSDHDKAIIDVTEAIKLETDCFPNIDRIEGCLIP